MQKFFKINHFPTKLEDPQSFLIPILIAYQCLFFFFDYVSHNYIHYVGPYEGLGFSTWEPMAGIGIGLLYVYERRFIPFLYLCPLVSEFIFGNEKISFWILIQSEIVSSTCYLTIVYLLKISSNFDAQFRRAQDILLLTFLAVLLTLINTSEYMFFLYILGYLQLENIFSAAWRFFVGELSGILSTAPLTLLLFYHTKWKFLFLQNFLQLVILTFFLYIIFGYPESSVFQLFYLLFLPAIWVAFTSGPSGSILVVLFIQIIAIIGSEIRFGSDTGRGSVQALIIALAITILIISAVVAENEDSSKRLRDQEIALNRAIRVKTTGETASTIAHEINQPLTAISTYVDVAKKAYALGDHSLLENVLDRLKKETERISAIIKSIRSLLKKENVIFSTIYMEDLCKDIMDVMKEEAKRANCDLSINNFADNTKIYGDVFQIQQAIINLVTNSAEALSNTKKQGKINVRIYNLSSKECAIEVEDDGPGFPSEYQLKGRLPFFSEKLDGTGMGLSIVQSIAEVHGGILELTPKTLGALVRIKLPIIK